MAQVIEGQFRVHLLPNYLSWRAVDLGKVRSENFVFFNNRTQGEFQPGRVDRL